MRMGCGWRQLKDDGSCGGRDGDRRSEERGRRENQVVREQPRKRSRKQCWTWAGEMGKRAGKGVAGVAAFSGEGGERERDDWF